MRPTFLILGFLFLLLPVLLSQNKRDYYWPFGKDQSFEPGVQATEFDFNALPFEPQERQGDLEFDRNNASISDYEGNLLFYSNGCAVANRLHQIMPNGDSINEGGFFDIQWRGDCGNGYPGRQDIMILPDPGNEAGYYILHNLVNIDFVTGEIAIDTLSYSYIDMTLDTGLGDVTVKNATLHAGLHLWSYLTAMRHANGRDWWIVFPDMDRGYHVYLLDSEGFHYDGLQSIGINYHWRNASASGDAKFSPDGTRYAYFNEFDGLQLYAFERESSQLEQIGQIDILIDTVQVGFASCEWSPSSEFLYLIKSDSIWQLDTWAEPLESGLEFIAAHNGVLDPLSTRFFISALGPDCRIYIRPGSGSNSFHVIHSPDERGVACDLQQQGIRLPNISATGSFPNFPRFRVDEEDKCDPSIVSAFGELVYYRRDLVTYPNPVHNDLTIELPEGVGDGMLYVLNMQGQMVYTKEVSVLTGSLQLSMSQLPVGLYAVEFVPRENKERVVYTSRVTRVE